jgi:hypothetical protein
VVGLLMGEPAAVISGLGRRWEEGDQRRVVV